MPILNYFLYLEQHSERVPFGDVPSQPVWVGTCLTFISFNIEASGLDSLETFSPTPGYVGTYYFINDQHHSYGSTTQNPCYRSPFSRPHIVSITVGHKNYRIYLSSDLCLSWLWIIHKLILHRSLFSRSHIISITIGHKHYKVSQGALKKWSPKLVELK